MKWKWKWKWKWKFKSILTWRAIRRSCKAGVFMSLLIIPLLEVYKRLYLYLPSSMYGELWKHFTAFATVDPILKGGYLGGLYVVMEAILAHLGLGFYTFYRFASDFSGYFWSVTYAGITFFDPLAALQMIFYQNTLTMKFVIALAIPIVLVLLFGPVFCSWMCPMNTLLAIARFSHNKLRIPYMNFVMLSTKQLRYIVLILGIILLGLKVIVFPYILPYAVLGRIVYYLSVGRLDYWAFAFIIVIVAIDTIVQNGFWCQFICPSGGLLNILGRKSWLKLTRDQNKCIETCNHCKKICQWGANPKVNDITSCTTCNRCVEECPGKALKISRRTF